MKMSGTQAIAAAPKDVWVKLNDPEVLKRCIPGCQLLEKTSPTEMKASVGLKIGPINATFDGAVTLSDLNPPTSYRISGSGKGPAGFANGGANVSLAAKDGGTELTYDVDANVGGKVAQLGGRLIDATAAMLAGQFFERFAAEFPKAEPVISGAVIPGAVDPSPYAVKPTTAGLPTWLWVAIGVAVIAGAIIYFRLGG